MSAYRRNEGMFQAAKLVRENANRIQTIRDRNKQLFEAKKNPTPYQQRAALAMDAALAKTQANHEADALALETDGMTPQQAARWIREQKIAAKKKAEKK